MSPARAWPRVLFDCPDRQSVDRVLAELESLPIAGCEESDSPDELWLRVYWSADVTPEQVEADAARIACTAGVRVRDRGVQAAEDWLEQWKRCFTPLKVTERLWVAPPWADVRAAVGEHVIVIEPKMAFGTGHHATTQLCLRHLDEVPLQGLRGLDVGAGSGILAIAAAKLGAAHVLALEPDHEAYLNAVENVALNGVQAQVEVRESALDPGAVPGADLIACNINTLGLLPLLPDLARIAPAGAIVLSGVSCEHRDSVAAAIADAGLTIQRETTLDDWWACVCKPYR